MSRPLRALIVDDEPVARELLRTMLGSLSSAIEVVGECGTAGTAVEAIRTTGPDVVFLDVQMPAGDGFEVIEAVGVETMPAVVFVTAHERFALKAFELPATDYLLKPFDEERLRTTVDRLLHRLAERPAEPPSRLLELLAALDPRGRHAERLAVESADHVALLPTAAILWLEAEGKNVRLHTQDGSHLLREGVSSVLARLSPREFLRIHRSTVVRIDRIREVHRWFRGYQLVLSDGTRLTSGATYKTIIEESLLGRPRG